MAGHSARTRARGVSDAELLLETGHGVVEVDGQCGQKMSTGGICTRQAGAGTAHFGVGPCAGHGGNSTYENAKGAYLMGHAIARGLNVSPWEALLSEVRRSAGEVSWLDAKIADAPNDDALLSSEPGGFAPWVRMRNEARKHLARVAKMAIDGGVAEKLVAQVQGEAQQLGQMVLAVLMSKDLALTEEQIVHARVILRNEMLAIVGSDERDESGTAGPPPGSGKVVDGTVA